MDGTSFRLPNNSLRIVYASGQHSYNVAHVLDHLQAVRCSRSILDGFAPRSGEIFGAFCPQGLRTTFPWVFWGFHGKYKIFI